MAFARCFYFCDQKTISNRIQPARQENCNIFLSASMGARLKYYRYDFFSPRSNYVEGRHLPITKRDPTKKNFLQRKTSRNVHILLQGNTALTILSSIISISQGHYFDKNSPSSTSSVPFVHFAGVGHTILLKISSLIKLRAPTLITLITNSDLEPPPEGQYAGSQKQKQKNLRKTA